MTAVGLYRAFGDTQPYGDLFVQHTGDKPAECFKLPRGQGGKQAFGIQRIGIYLLFGTSDSNKLSN